MLMRHVLRAEQVIKYLKTKKHAVVFCIVTVLLALLVGRLAARFGKSTLLRALTSTKNAKKTEKHDSSLLLKIDEIFFPK